MSLIPHTRGFKIAFLNIVSLLANIDELRLSMEDQNLDVLAINECRLCESVTNSSIHIPGYDIITRDRNRNGGGVCVYIRTTISFNERITLRNDNYEAIVVDISKPNSPPFSIIAAYRLPETDDRCFLFFKISSAFVFVFDTTFRRPSTRLLQVLLVMVNTSRRPSKRCVKNKNKCI